MVDAPRQAQNPPPRPPQPPVQPQRQPSNSPTPPQKQGRDSADRPQQKDIDEQRKGGAGSSKNWYREEGSVIGKDPASIDFVGAYPWPNVAEPGENRDDDTPIVPPMWRDEDLQETPAEEQRRKSEMDARARRKFAERVDDDPLEKDYPTNPASAFRTQREKDEQNAPPSDHSVNKPAPANRPSA